MLPHHVLPEIFWQVRCSVCIPAVMILSDNIRSRTYLLSFGFSRLNLCGGFQDQVLNICP